MKVEAINGPGRIKQLKLTFSIDDSVTLGYQRARQLACEILALTGEVESQPGTLDAVRSFALDALNMRNNGLDGFDVEQLGVKHGLLIPSIHHKPCGEHCRCEWMANDIEKGVTCFRIADVLLCSGEVA